MKQRWRPSASEKAIKRTIVLSDELWEWGRDQPEGATGLIRRLLGQERHAQATRRVLSVPTPAGEMQAISNGDGMIITLEDDVVLYFELEKGQSVPVIKIPALPSQVVSVRLRQDQTIQIPLQRGQTVFITAPVTSLEKRMAKAPTRRATKDAADGEPSADPLTQGVPQTIDEGEGQH